MIEAIDVFGAEVPMRTSFVHASHSRSVAESVLVRVQAQGEVGWGEGAPRKYVTGESMDSALDALKAVSFNEISQQIDLSSFSDAVNTIAAIPVWHTAPAARAALEIALLDLACRVRGRTLHDVLLHVAGPELLHERPIDTGVSFVIGLSGTPSRSLQKLGDNTVGLLRHVKVKATSDIADSLAKVAEVQRKLAPTTSISIDVNGAWAPADVLAHLGQLRTLNIAWIEEPTTARDWATMRALVQAGVPVMLDESFTSASDLEDAVAEGAATHVNVRVSKCGGVLPALKHAAYAHANGLHMQLGVQVGELGPLWAASRALGTSLRHLETMEAGKQDEWFESPLTEPPYMVDRSSYRASPLDGLGVGVVPTPTLLAHLEHQHQQRAAASL